MEPHTRIEVPAHQLRNLVRAAVLALLAALLAALEACGGGTGPTSPPASAPPPSTAPPAARAELSAAVSSPESGVGISCRDDIHARVALTNRSASAVLVTGVHKSGSVVAGNCFAGADYTYPTGYRLVAPDSTEVVFDRALYSNGSGCCREGGRCSGSCRFQQSFEVVTEAGSVPAGNFVYGVTFSNCVTCASAAAASVANCPAVPLDSDGGTPPGPSQ